ncbi:MAG: ATP-binding protein [Elusimicrobia bacterium]|nr:ATP-binding protein [Elusimicrobiota bacterium]
MEKWQLQPHPSESDPTRYVLSFKGEVKDVLSVVKRFGSKCGRPRRITNREGFNYALFLNEFSQDQLEQLTKMLIAIVPSTGPELLAPLTPSQPAAPPMPVFTPPPAPAPAQPEAPAMPVFTPPPAPAPVQPEAPPMPVFAPPPAPAPAVTQPAQPAPTVFAAAEPPPAFVQPPGEAVPAFALPPPPSASGPTAPAADASNPFVVESPPPAMAAPPLPGGSPAVFGAPAPASPSDAFASQPPIAGEFTLAPPGLEAPATVAQPAAAAPGAPVSMAPPAKVVRPLWGLETALDEKTNLDSIQVGPYNRFSHAAAASVVGAPGNMYNPLFVFGAAGVGKSHMIKAIGGGLEKSLGGGVVLTSGVKLANAVSRALEEGKYPELEKRLGEAKALLVDDIHLLNVTEENQGSLAKIFALFFSRNLQVVLTSLYPARALGALEEALKISLRKGWSVDMKLAAGDAQKEMVTGAFSRLGLELTSDEIGLFVERLGGNMPEAARWVRRFASLRAFQEAQGTPSPFDKELATLFAQEAVAAGLEIPSAQELEAARSFAPPAPGPSARGMAIFVPKGQEPMMAWATSKFYESLLTLKIEASYKHVIFEAYDADQPFGVPFKIGDTARKAAADIALVVGTPPASPLASRVAEFSHAVGHILDGLDIAMGWLPFDGTKNASNLFRVHLDFLAKTE